MNRPTWVTIVGVIAIVFAAFGILSSAQWLFMPVMLDFQKSMLSEMSATSAGPGTDQPAAHMFESMEKMLEVPSWYPAWSVVAGAVSMCVVGFYLFAAIQLLQMKASSLKVFYSAGAAWIVLATFKAAVAVVGSSFLALGTLPSALAGTVVNVVLLVVVHKSDKSCFVDRASVGATQGGSESSISAGGFS